MGAGRGVLIRGLQDMVMEAAESTVKVHGYWVGPRGCSRHLVLLSLQ